MHDVRRVDVMEGVLDENDHIAEHIKKKMTEDGILVVNQMGAPGVGKTTVLKAIISGMPDIKSYVIEGDIESDIDTQDLRKLGIEVKQINTFGACHLDAPLIEHQLSHEDWQQEGILFIENIGNLVCPAEFSIGEHVKMLISSVTEGSDKPYKYPLAFEKADIIILNKIDLMQYTDFNEDFFIKGLRGVNKNVPVFKVSGINNEGVDQVVQWFKERRECLKK